MDFPSVEQSLSLTRADFDMNTFRRLIAQKGLKVEWKQAGECPCQPKSEDRGFDLTDVDDIDSGVGNVMGCPVCNGTGLVYHSPQEIQAIVSNAEGEYLNARYGGYREGLVSVTLNPEHLPVFGDRFTLVDSVMLYRETFDLTHPSGAVAGRSYNLRFPIASRTVSLAGGEETHDIIYLHITDPDTGLAEVDGDHTVDWRGPNQGYEVVDGKLKINNSSRFKDGMRIGLTYFINPSYTVVSYPNSIRDTRIRKKSNVDKHTPMPVRVQAKLEFLELEG
jgi:hypothetical protein